MSEVKVNKISPRSGTAVTLGDSGDTFTVPTGAGLTATDEIKSNKISPATGTALQIGDSGDTITIPSGATITNSGTATGFGATGSASWTSTVKTATFTAVAGEGYFCNTTSGAFTVNLPAGSAGAVVAVKDYANTFDTNALTISPNGSDKIGGSTDDVVLSAEGIAITLVFVDSTKGWLVTDSGLQSEASQLINAEFLLVAGGGSGGVHNGAGAGAGGLRTSFGSTSGGGASAESNLSLNPGTQYTITIGAGAAAVTTDTSPGVQGNNSSMSGSEFTTITCVGGGAAGGNESGQPGGNGGSGGGAGQGYTAGSGTSGQGYAGGDGDSGQDLGGGGGAGAVGQDGSDGNYGGAGGAGLQVNIDGNGYYWAGGGGGCAYESGDTAGAGGIGGGGGGSGGSNASGGAGGGSAKNPGGAGNSVGPSGDTAGSGGANTGSGGGGKSRGPSGASGAGGSGICILRLSTSNYTGTTTGSPTVATSGTDTILTYTGSGTYTA